MSRQLIFDFLTDLAANNSKDWMDAHRRYYQEARGLWIDTVAQILGRLAKYDAYYDTLQPKKTVMRINNNRMFHPDRPIYKDHFAFSPTRKEDPAFYLQVSPEDSCVGGGLWHPESKVLRLIREAIDYDAQELISIIRAPAFVKVYGSLDLDADALKTSPQGYSQDHPYIDLLRRKNITALAPITRSGVVDNDFVDRVEEAFVAIRPLNQWLAKAIEYEP